MWRRERGNLLLELIVSMGIFTLLIGLLFAAFHQGTRIFGETTVRQSTARQMRNIRLLLGRDAKLANFWNSTFLSRYNASYGYRDALALSALSDWDDPTKFDGFSGRPLWDRYVVWYATEELNGKLYRQLVAPSFTGPSLIDPYDTLPSNVSNIDPNNNDDIISSRLLSESVRNFRLDLRAQDGTLRAVVRLLSKGGPGVQTQTRVEDHLEVEMTFELRNSWPKI